MTDSTELHNVHNIYRNQSLWRSGGRWFASSFTTQGHRKKLQQFQKTHTSEIKLDFYCSVIQGVPNPMDHPQKL